MSARQVDHSPPPPRLYSSVKATNSQTETFLRAMGCSLGQGERAGERPNTSRFQSGLVGDYQIELFVSPAPLPLGSSQQTEGAATADVTVEQQSAGARQPIDCDAEANPALHASTIDADRLRRFLKEVPMPEGLAVRLALLLNKDEDTGPIPGPLRLRGGFDPDDIYEPSEASNANPSRPQSVGSLRLDFDRQVRLQSVAPSLMAPEADYGDSVDVESGSARLNVTDATDQAVQEEAGVASPAEEESSRHPGQAHWIHPTRRKSPYENLHEHDEDPRMAEKLREEQEKDRGMKELIEKHKEQRRRSLIPVIDLTAESSGDEAGVGGMEVDE